jgi:soluble lytic murein transglycosylase-like protein
MHTTPTRVLLLAIAHVSILGLVPTDSADLGRVLPAYEVELQKLPFSIDSLPKRPHNSTPAPPISEIPAAALVLGLPFELEIQAAAARHGVDSLLLAAIVKAESGFNPDAVSARGAVGLMQILPSTANEEMAQLFDPARNLDCGAAYLRSLLEAFGGDLELSLAAYNAGPTQVRRHGGMPPFAETRAFVGKVLAIYADFQSPL